MRGILILAFILSFSAHSKLFFDGETEIRDDIVQLYIRNHIIFACPELFENQDLEVESENIIFEDDRFQTRKLVIRGKTRYSTDLPYHLEFELSYDKFLNIHDLTEVDQVISCQ